MVPKARRIKPANKPKGGEEQSGHRRTGGRRNEENEMPV